MQLSGVYFMRAWLGGATCELDIIEIYCSSCVIGNVMESVTLQELLDDTLDLKIEIVDEMLFAVYAFACVSTCQLGPVELITVNR